MKELEDVYDTILNESSDPTRKRLGKTFEDEKGVDEGVDKDTGPEAADGYEKDIDDTDAPVKEQEETVKNKSDNININMNDKNIFDKLYSTIMEDGEDLDVGGLEAGLEDEPMDGFGDEEGGEEVTLTLTTDQADALREVLSQLEEPVGDDIEDLDAAGEDPFGGGPEEENPFPEAVEADHTSQGNQPGQDPTQLGPNKKNVVPGTASKTTSGGASSASTDKVGNDGNLADTTAKMTSTGSRSNVVSGKVTGNNQVAAG